MTARVRLPNERASFAKLRAFAEGFAAAQGCSETMGYRIVLILEELFANVHKYSLGDPPAASVEVGLERDGDTLVVDFTDDGGAFNPLAMPPPRIDRSLEERPIGGLGIHIVRSMAGETRYERSAGRNRLVVREELVPGIFQVVIAVGARSARARKRARQSLASQRRRRRKL